MLPTTSTLTPAKSPPPPDLPGPATSMTSDIKPDPRMLTTLLHGSPLPSSNVKPMGASAPQRGGRGLVQGHQSHQNIYVNKLRKIKKAIKDTIFLNGAVCDEVLRTEEKLSKAKEERRFLLRKLLQHQSASETSALLKTEPLVPMAGRQGKTPVLGNGLGLGDTPPQEPPSKPPKGVKRKAPSSSPLDPLAPTAGLGAAPIHEGGKKVTKSGKDIKNSGAPRAKKGKGALKKVIPPLMLDSLGRPVFPMALGDVTLHSIGEIVPELSSFHCVESIYPLGYCSTRVYTSLHTPGTRCLYTCKISDDLDEPQFEIAAEDSSDLVFKGDTPNQCHSQLLAALNKARGDVVSTEGRGLDFFGLSHPVIQNLIQSCPGARKCQRYKWVKFEINKSETNDNVAVGTADPRVSWGALHIHMQALGQSRTSSLQASASEQSNNLRSLLTKTHHALTGT